MSSQPWSGDAAVHVSIVNWTKDTDVSPKVLRLKNGDARLELPTIPSSLSPNVDVRSAVALPVNSRPKVIHQGQTTGLVAGYMLWPNDAEGMIAKDPGSASFVHPFLGGDQMLHKLD